jgi:hypothetical protein
MSSTFQINIASSIVNLTLGCVFFLLCLSSSLHSGETCQETATLSWGFYAGVYHWLGFSLVVVFYWFVRKYERPETPKTVRFTTNLTFFLMFINLYMFLPFVIFAIAMATCSFDEQEDCGWLSTFGKFYSILGILFLCGKCFQTAYKQANMQTQINTKSRVRLLQRGNSGGQQELDF